MRRISGIMCNCDKRSNIHVTKVSEGKEKENGTEKEFEEIIANDSPNLAKDINLQNKESD